VRDEVVGKSIFDLAVTYFQITKVHSPRHRLKTGSTHATEGRVEQACRYGRRLDCTEEIAAPL